MQANIIHLDETDSTNRWLRDYVPAEGEEATICVADYQTAGRGCGTNSWESERGKNLLFSLLIHPQDIPAQEQFHISMAAALALCDAMRDFGIQDTCVKWPNDLYWHDCKLAGILIEHRLAGDHIRDSIIGIGLNVNQQQFRSDAPNPVSMRQILGHDIDRSLVLQSIASHLSISPCMLDFTAMRYNAQLYRRQGYHSFRDADGAFRAAIMEVDRQGRLWLRKEDGTVCSYAFKEVEHVIKMENEE